MDKETHYSKYLVHQHEDAVTLCGLRVVLGNLNSVWFRREPKESFTRYSDGKSAVTCTACVLLHFSNAAAL